MMHLNGLGTPRSCSVATQLLKTVAERGPWGKLLKEAHSFYLDGQYDKSLLLYLHGAEMGMEVAQSNAAWMIDKGYGELSHLHPPTSTRLTSSPTSHWTEGAPLGPFGRALKLWSAAAKQGNVEAEVKIGDYHYWGLAGMEDYEKAAAHYRLASEQRNPQAMFNLGYLHHRGIGVKRDLHLAKRYYDLASSTSAEAYAPVTLALILLYFHTTFPEVETVIWETHQAIGLDNLLIALLSLVLLYVLWLRSRKIAVLRRYQEEVARAASMNGNGAAGMGGNGANPLANQGPSSLAIFVSIVAAVVTVLLLFGLDDDLDF
eukprot:GILI01023194.1.p1 GENE.GILI01023194.1~~GILI01023194.1.p1  ORF type:complete len:350 (+),score=53.21 GILI01023194.1:102-1052(+)